MPRYSSTQFYKDWRYAVEKNFTTGNGEPFPFAEGGEKKWGDEIKKLSFREEPHDGCISSDGTRMAIAVRHDIHIVDTDSWETIAVLKGHTSRVNAVAFQSNDANTLVSSAQHDYGRSEPGAKPTLIVWKIDRLGDLKALEGTSLSNVSEIAAAAADRELARLGVELMRDKVQELAKGLEATIHHVVTENLVKDATTICGRLQTSFQSQVFSPSGKWMVYMPEERPPSNSNAPWDIVICGTDDYRPRVTLKGHTDAITWMGWNRDESIIATVAWDGTIRIWNPVTGIQTHRFETECQNWTGTFSADSKHFVATDGKGRIHTYAISQDEPSERTIEVEGAQGWRRAAAWHPSGKWLAVGGDRLGGLLLVDVAEQKIIQERSLSTKASHGTEETKRMMQRCLGVSEVCFVDHGHKLAVWTYGDSSIEVYDLMQQVRWRFGRGGTDEKETPGGEWVDEEGSVTSQGGRGMLCWEDASRGRLMLASIDFDAVRIWLIELSGEPSS
ncbi:WD40 repeat-like-containing domain protein [Moelleriella libera RCEF 2490]|uniref:WD40 repeat-like-containing domain protein n=1 Tax=Moelleriella libera RCEF 2490 TaxID=1081109 RepID=A0A167WXT9_9HYPO|nr:WD40 repeat-like-containing domain protein [Moelleriella libera RCEF 2490]